MPFWARAKAPRVSRRGRRRRSPMLIGRHHPSSWPRAVVTTGPCACRMGWLRAAVWAAVVGVCTRAPSRRPAGTSGASAVHMRPIDPCRWGWTPCPALVELSRVGTRAPWHRFDIDGPEASQATARRRLSESSDAWTCRHRTHRRPSPALRPLRDSRIHARFHPTLQVRELVAVAAPYCRRDRPRRDPRRHAAICRVVLAVDAIRPSPGMQSKLWLRGPDRPLRGRSGPRRQGQVLARARAGTGISCYGHQAGKTLADGCG